jgi:Trypsin
VKRLLFVLVALSVFAWSDPAGAIKNGVPDNGAHPYVGQLLFFVPDAIDPRFDDPGAWFTCTGTLLDEDTVVTAGHCTFAVGLNGASTTVDGGDGSGGNDVWINFEEEPDFSILPPSATFVPDRNAERYAAWSAALNASSEWHRATSFPHPQYDDNAFFLFDAGVIELLEPVAMEEYGQLPTLGLLDTLYPDRNQRYTAVGFGLEESGPFTAEGGDTRRRADLALVNLNGVLGAGKGTAAKFSSNRGRPHTGGTCFGDSGGPIFVAGTTTLTAVISFGTSSTCSGTSGGYRLDQTDDINFVSSFGINP